MPLEEDLTGSERWEFDAAVADNFDDMLERSIPQYSLMRELCYRLARPHVTGGKDVVDLGCSRGGALASFAQPPMPGRLVGLEVSEPMLAAARERFQGVEGVEIRRHDLRDGVPVDLSACVVLSVLTLQFTPIEHRQRILRQVYERLVPGGAFVLVEKVLGDGSILEDEFVVAYWAAKAEHGYSEQEIRRKALALEGVLVPVTARWNENMLSRAGFENVDCFWRYLNFGGWLAIKGGS